MSGFVQSKNDIFRIIVTFGMRSGAKTRKGAMYGLYGRHFIAWYLLMSSMKSTDWYSG